MAPLDEQDHAHARTYAQAADDLRVSQSTIKRLVANGELDRIRVGVGKGRVFITRASIVGYLNRHHERGGQP